MNDTPGNNDSFSRFVFKGGTAQILAISPLPEGIDSTTLQIQPLAVGKKPVLMPFAKKPGIEP